MTLLLNSIVHGSRSPPEGPLPHASPCSEARACWQVTCGAEQQVLMERDGLQGRDRLPVGLGLPRSQMNCFTAAGGERPPEWNHSQAFIPQEQGKSLTLFPRQS